MHRTLLLALCAALLFSACGDDGRESSNASTSATPATNQSATARTPATATPETQVVTASAEEVRIDAGGSAEAAVRLDIAEGYHVNANPPSDKFYIGTEITAEPQDGIAPGKPAYPPALTKKFGFAKEPLRVYEGRPVIKLPLRAERAAAKGSRTFRAGVRVQPCNDQACLNPRTIEAVIPVVVN